MPFNGSGTYTPPAADFPATAGTVITAAEYNAVINDIASALSTVVLRDGSTPLSGDMDLGGNRVTNFAAGTAIDPAFEWTGNNGFFLKDTNQLGVAIAGALAAYYSDTGLNACAIGATDASTGKFTTLNATGEVDFDAAVNMDSTLNVEGATTIDDTLNVTGNVTFDGDLTVDGALNGIAEKAKRASTTAIKGLLAYRTSGTSMTYSYDEAVFWHPTEETTYLVRNVSGGTVSTATSGPTAGGRDQADAFASGSEIHLYVIWNGTTTSAIWSLKDPGAGGPTLPTGYHSWCYAFSCLTAGLTDLYEGLIVRGNKVRHRNQTSSPVSLTLTTANQTVGLTVPQMATAIAVMMQWDFIHSSAGGQFTVRVSQSASGGANIMWDYQTRGGAAGVSSSLVVDTEWVLRDQDFQIMCAGSAPATSNTMTVKTMGFTVPNGDS